MNVLRQPGFNCEKGSRDALGLEGKDDLRDYEFDQRRRRRLLARTHTELSAMAAAASHGVSKMWKAG